MSSREDWTTERPVRTRHVVVPVRVLPTDNLIYRRVQLVHPDWTLTMVRSYWIRKTEEPAFGQVFVHYRVEVRAFIEAYLNKTYTNTNKVKFHKLFPVGVYEELPNGNKRPDKFKRPRQQLRFRIIRMMPKSLVIQVANWRYNSKSVWIGENNCEWPDISCVITRELATHLGVAFNNDIVQSDEHQLEQIVEITKNKELTTYLRTKVRRCRRCVNFNLCGGKEIYLYAKYCKTCWRALDSLAAPVFDLGLESPETTQ